MTYLGHFNEENLPNIEGHRLFTFVNDDVDVIINYNVEFPFNITQIAVLKERNDNYVSFDVYECDIPSRTDTEAKSIAGSFARQLIEYRRAGRDLSIFDLAQL